MIAKIEKINGNKMIVIDGKPYLPVAYRSFRPMPSNIYQFHRSGVKLYQIQVTGRANALGTMYSLYGGVWTGARTYDFGAFDRQMAMLKKFAPDCKVMVMVQLDAPLWWLEKHPKSPDGYWCIGEAAFDEDWKADATHYLQSLVKYAEEKYGDDIFAYSYSCGIATEWFDKLEYYQPSEKKLDAYKQVSSFDRASTKEEMYDVSGDCMRQPCSNEATYRNFCSTLTPKLIKHFAKAVKEAMDGRKLVGIFYGYVDCPDEGYQIASATNGYEEVWKDENIDMLFSPAAYSFDGTARELDGPSSYQYLVDSVEVNDKLYLHEIDHRTHLSYYPLENGRFMWDCYDDLFTTVEVLRRELAAALCKGASLWWFDFYGNYYACPELEEEIKKQIEVAQYLVQKPHASVSEIAVFADPLSFNLLKEKLNLTVDYVRHNIHALQKAGAPIDLFNLADITKIDKNKYKMFVFLYAPSITQEVRKEIDGLGDKLKVFLHLPNVASGEKLSLPAVEEICGMRFALETECDKVNYADKTFGFSKKVSPLLKIADENAEIIARYENGDGAVAVKGNTAYVGVGNAPSELWRALSKLAGVHLYTEETVPLYVDSRFVACHFPGDKQDVLAVKEDGRYTELFTGKTYEAKDGKLTFTHYNYQMMIFAKE